MPLFSYTGDFDFLRWKPKKIYKNLGVLKNGVNPPCFSDHENTAGKKGILISNFEKIPPEITGVLIFCRGTSRPSVRGNREGHLIYFCHESPFELIALVCNHNQYIQHVDICSIL